MTPVSPPEGGPGAGDLDRRQMLKVLAAAPAVVGGLLTGAGAFASEVSGKSRAAGAGRRRGGRRRVIVLGFDGLDFHLTRRWMQEGKLPNLARLAAKGSFLPLRSTYPAASPVAWSTFMAGSNPGKTGIFDFTRLCPDRYELEPACPRVIAKEPGGSGGRLWGPVAGLAAGGLMAGGLWWRQPRPVCTRRYFLGAGALAGVTGLVAGLAVGECVGEQGPEVTYAPAAHIEPFWKLLGEAGRCCVSLLVPASFPAQPFPNGRMLSGWPVPGPTGGRYFVYSTQRYDSGYRQVLEWVPLEAAQRVLSAPGPEVTWGGAGGPRLRGVRIHLRRETTTGAMVVRAGKTEVSLAPGEWSPWVPYRFERGWRTRRRGLARFCLVSAGSPTTLLMLPVCYHPTQMPDGCPVGWPPGEARALTREEGVLPPACEPEGLLDALVDEVIDDETFLAAARESFRSRWGLVERDLKRPDWDCLVAVWTETDRVQHAFWRYLDPDHPAHPEEPSPAAVGILELYQQADRVVGECLDRYLGTEDVLLVVSDHGFASFRRAVILNRWLVQEGYLTYRTGASSDQPLSERVDWERTRAFALGLAGIRINLLGREPRGVVTPGEEHRALCEELMEKLGNLVDLEAEPPVHPLSSVYKREELYRGPWLASAADVVVCWKPGYRTQLSLWQGELPEQVFVDNTRRWSGDHVSMDPELLPGVLFSSLPLADSKAGLEDMAPTVLALLGVSAPADMDGRSLLSEGESPSA